MKLLKFYGRTVGEALQMAVDQLGEDPLIVETRSLSAGSPEAPGFPEGGVEVTAAVDVRPETLGPATFGHFIKQKAKRGEIEVLQRRPSRRSPEERKRLLSERVEVASASRPAAGATPRGEPSRLLEDLGLLKSQVRTLLDQSGEPYPDIRDQADLKDYRFLIARGVDPRILQGSFRRWLDWRTMPERERFSTQSCAGGPQGSTLREWLWWEWTHRLEGRGASTDATSGKTMVGVVGGNGVGKSTVLAKLASKSRQSGRRRVGIMSLDATRFGATEQWKQLTRLMDIEFIPVINHQESTTYIQRAREFDWLGIDTPGGFDASDRSGRLYGALLAEFDEMKTSIVLDATAKDCANQCQIDRLRDLRPDRLIFTKLDQTPEPASMLNLTFDDRIALGAISSGTRIPEDIHEATPETLWRWAFDEVSPAALDGAGLREAVA